MSSDCKTHLLHSEGKQYGTVDNQHKVADDETDEHPLLTQAQIQGDVIEIKVREMFYII